MKGPAMLLAHSLKRVRVRIIVFGILLAAFQVLLIVMAKAFHKSNSFAGMADLLPPFVREFFGPSLASFLSFGGMISQVYFHPLVVGSLVGLTIAISTTPTLEIESGFMDLILSRPLARHWIITRTILVLAICVVVLLVTMTTATWVGLAVFGPEKSTWPSPAHVLGLAANLGLLMLCWSGVALAIGSVARRRGAAGTLAGFLALTTFLLDYVARAWRPAESLAWVSPFHYYNALELIMGVPLDARDLLVLGGIAVTGFVFAYAFFSRRDLSQ